jgi:hypothetical protein
MSVGIRRLLSAGVVSLCVMVGALLVFSASALAAAPEAPTLTVEEPVHATDAIVHGVLDPTKEGAPGTFEMGTYQFLYKASKTKACEEGSVAPASPGISLGAGNETFSEVLSPLAVATEYAVCLEVETAGGKTVSTPVIFKTALPPEKPETISPAEEITATSATFEGVLNPKKAGEAGNYEFLYRISPTECEGESATANKPAAGDVGEKVKAKGVGPLQPNATYTFCLRARNAAGETAVGPAVHFTTALAPPTIVRESASHHSNAGQPLNAGEARLEGVVNPNNQVTECHFQYGESSVSEHEAPCEPELLKGFGEQNVAVVVGGLQPGNTYHFQMLAKNGRGEAAPVVERTVIPPAAPALPTAPAPATTAVTATSAMLHGVLNPQAASAEAGSYEFLYSDSGSECQHGSATPVTATSGAKEEVQAEASGLLPNVKYTFCLVAHNDAGETSVSAPVTFTTRTEGPSVAETSFSQTGSTGVTVDAQINPGGLETAYSVQYGTSTAYGSQTTPAHVVPGTSSAMVAVTVPLSGLQPSTGYHLRLVVTNADGEAVGGDVAFTTYPTGTTGLPDGRVYEMVSPPEDEDAEVYTPFVFPDGTSYTDGEGGIHTRLPFQAAANGEAVTYVGDPTVAGTGSSGEGEGNEYLATRSATGGWSQVNIQPPGDRNVYYQAFSSNLSVGILQSGEGGIGFEEPRISEGGKPGTVSEEPEVPLGGYKFLFTHETMAGGTGVYRPLFATNPPNRSASTFRTAAFPEIDNNTAGVLAYAGGSADLGNLLFEANAVLAPGAIEGGEEANNLYEWSDGQPSLVNVLPGGGSEVGASFGAPALDKSHGNPPDFSNVISEDGAKVFWTDLNTEHVYVREDGTSTVPVSEGAARYWTATPDGRYAFYTEDEGNELWRFDVEGGTGHEREELAGPGAGVQGVIGVSESGEYVYFVATEDLSRSETNGQGVSAAEGADNLYVLHERSNGWEAPKFIATLSGADGSDALGPELNNQAPRSESGDWQPGLGHRTAEITPNGGSLVFMSNNQSVEGYSPTVDGQELEEVYVYEYATNRLICASCVSTHEQPPANTLSVENGVGGVLPISWSNTYLPNWISEDGGRVVFDSVEPLVAQDTNGQPDVYEWERDKEGTCAESKGCIYLLSGGTGNAASYLVGESANGDDVFIDTRTRLVEAGQGDEYAVYDARIDGVKPISPPACTGTGCQGVPAPPPTFATPPSVTFAGIGNFPPVAPVKPTTKPAARSLTRAQKLAAALKACKKQKRKHKRLSCETQAKKRYGDAGKNAKRRK